MKKFWTLAFLLLSIGVVAQPINDDCAGIIDLGEAPFCPTDLFFTNEDATPSDIGNFNVPTLGNCDGLGPMENDVWFSFIASDTIEDYTITVTGMDDGSGSTPLMQPQIVIYRGDCEFDGLEPVDCVAAEPGESIADLTISGLDAGLPYFIRVTDWNATGGDQEGTFLLCVEEADPVLILDEDITTDLCQGEIYDSGGEAGDYSPGENYTLTITPPQPVSCITFMFEYYNIDNFSDAITFYDGPNTNSTPIASITGNNFSDGGGGGVCFSVQASSGSLTMQFTSDGSLEFEGFHGFWECSTQSCDEFELIEISTDIDDQTIIDAVSTPLTTVTIDNIDCPTSSLGVFQNGEFTDLGLEKGIVLSSGSVINNGFNIGIDNPGNIFASAFTGGGSDSDLDYLSTQSGGSPSNDACVIELDVFVATDELRFEYVFGSEEYPEYVNSTFNDIFALLISGPGIVGDPNIGNQENIATVPNPGIPGPVEINSVNNLVNWEFYRNNLNGPSVVYDGLTSDYLGVKKSLTAIAQVQPCTTYHLKFAIADRGDSSFDSGVFVSEIKGGTPTLDITYNNGIDYLVEECGTVEDEVVIQLDTDLDAPVTYDILVEGTATPGADYNLNLPPSITFSPGNTQFSFPISAIADGLTEGIETIEVSLVANFGCGSIVFTTLVIEIHDDLLVEIFAGQDTAYVCQGNSVVLDVVGANNYFWTSQEPGIFSPAADIPNPIATPTVDQEVYVIGFLGLCNDIDTVYLDVVDPMIEIAAVGETEFCVGDSVLLVAQNNVGNSGISWTPEIGVFDPESATTFVGPANTTTYTAMVELEGCSASDQITISVDPFDPPMLANDTTICQNFPVQLGTDIPFTTTTYEWTPPDGLDDETSPAPVAIPQVTTTYTVTATSVNAFCDQTESITVTVIPADVEIVEPTPDTLEICLGEMVDLTALTTTLGAGFTWSPDDGSIMPSLTDTVAIASPTQSTTYFATLVVGACTVTDSLFVRVDSLPFNDITQLVPDRETYCEGDLITIISPTYEPANFPDIEHLWIPETGQQTPDSLWNLVISATESATYQRITINNACSDTAEVEIIVIPTTNLDLTPLLTSICQGDSVQLNATSPNVIENISWNVENNISCEDCLDPIVTPQFTTEYMVSGEYEGCPVTSNSAIVEVTSLPDPMLPNVQPLCPGNSITLWGNPNVDPDATYTWSVGGTVVSNDPLQVFTPNQTTTYTLLIEKPGCTETYTVTVEVLTEEPTALIIEDQLICQGDTTFLNIVSNPEIDAWTWTFNGEVVANGANIEVTPPSSGFYVATGNFDCYTITDSVFVDVSTGFNIDSISVIPPGEVFEGSPITVEAFTNPAVLMDPTYTWTIANITLDTSANPLDLVVPSANGQTTSLSIMVEIMDAIGCSNTASTSIIVLPSNYEIPNIFTPNGDDSNDRFRVLKNEAVTIVEFKVYNRWGQVVYDNEAGDQGWDGRQNGEPAPSDVYGYMVVLELGDGTMRTEKGEVTLVR